MTFEVVQDWSDTMNLSVTRRRRRWVWGYPGWNSAPDASVTYETVSVTKNIRNRSWRRNPLFKLQKVAGIKLPDLPFSYVGVKSTSSSGKVLGPYGYAWDRYQTVWEFPGFTSLAPEGTSIVNADVAYARLVNNVRSDAVNVPVFLAESRQTASMVVQRAQSIVLGLRALKKGDLREFKRQLHRDFAPSQTQLRSWKKRINLHQAGRAPSPFASIWLEARYGWIPFMSEAYNAGLALSQLQAESENLYFRVTGKAKARTQWNTNNVSLMSLGSDGGLVCNSTTTHEEEVKVVWHYMPTEWASAGLFGFTNPLEVAWELVPFSFVADWFFPIGNYLAQLDVTSRFAHAGGTIGRKKVTTVVYQQPRQSLSSEGCAIEGFGGLSSTRTVISRQPLMQSPSVGLNSLSFDPNINAKRVIDSIALIRNVILR